MHRPWWKRLLDRGRGQWWPVHYRIDGSAWWSFRGKQYLFRELNHGVPAPSVSDELPDSGRTREPWEFFDGD